MTSVNLRNVLVLLGIIVTISAIAYFVGQFGGELSAWGRVLDFALLATFFIALGAHFSHAGDETELVERTGWRWLRVTNALYILGAVGVGATVISFFTVDSIRPIVKVLVSLVAGIAMILLAAQRWGRRDKAP